jgi:hypothetical protein
MYNERIKTNAFCDISLSPTLSIQFKKYVVFRGVAWGGRGMPPARAAESKGLQMGRKTNTTNAKKISLPARNKF